MDWLKCTVLVSVFAVGGCTDESEPEPEDATGLPQGSGGSGEEDACEPFTSNPPSPGITTVVLRNDTAAPIFVGDYAACELIAFSLQSGGEAYRYKINPCGTTCAEAIAGACNSGCGACDSFSVVRIAPGAQWEYTWDRLGHGAVSLPDECGVDNCSSCERPHDLNTESVTVRAQAHTSCVEDDCDCGTDVCELDVGALPDDGPITAEVDFNPTTDEQVVVVFD